MSIGIAKFNAPYDMVSIGDGRSMCFGIVTFDATAVEGVTGTTYDTTANHYSTNFKYVPQANNRPFDLWGMREIEQIEFHGGASDATLQRSGGGSSTTGRCKPEFIASTQTIKLKVCGAGGVTNPVPQDELELDTTANAMDALAFYCVFIGRCSTQRST